MDEEVKRRRKEKEKQAAEQRLAEEQTRKMEQNNKHLLANLYSQKPIHNQSLAPSLAQSQILKQKQNINQNLLQRTQTGNIPQLQRMQATCSQSSLQQPSQNPNLLSLQRNASQTQQMTHKSWFNSASITKQGPLQNTHSLTSSFPQLYPQSLIPSFSQLKEASLPRHQTALSPNLSSKNPLDEIFDLTSPSPSPDSTEGGLNLDSLTRHTVAYGDEFNLESLMSPNVTIVPPAAQLQQPLLLQQQQQHLQTTQQQNHSLLANNQPDLLDLLDFPLSPQMPMQKGSPSSSTSSCSSSTSSVANNLVPQVSSGLVPTSLLIQPSLSSSRFPSASSLSLFSNSSSRFPSNYLLPQSDSLPLHNGNCSSGTLDVREALNSMLQGGPDRKSVIHYRQQD